MTTSADMFDPAQRKAAFEASGQREKAKRLLDAIDTACKCLDLPLPAGQRGVEFVGELSGNAMLQIRWLAKLRNPPSFETFGELFRLIKERT